MAASQYQGMRVIPGNEWTLDDVAKDEIGTIIKYDQVEGSKKYIDIKVAWDSGKYSSFKYPTGNVLKIVNTDILGVLHGEECSHCNRRVAGILWTCETCQPNNHVYLCSICYHGDQHSTKHKFYRIDMEKKTRVIRPERKKSQKIPLHGICNGATVIGRDVENYSNAGRVIGFDFRNRSWIAQVKWNKDSPHHASSLAEEFVISKEFQREHPLKYTKPKTWISVYRDHLPEPRELDLGEYGYADSDVSGGSLPSADVSRQFRSSADISRGPRASADVFEGSQTSVDVFGGSQTSVDVFEGSQTSADFSRGPWSSADITVGSEKEEVVYVDPVPETCSVDYYQAGKNARVITAFGPNDHISTKVSAGDMILNVVDHGKPDVLSGEYNGATMDFPRNCVVIEEAHREETPPVSPSTPSSLPPLPPRPEKDTRGPMPKLRTKEIPSFPQEDISSEPQSDYLTAHPPQKGSVAHVLYKFTATQEGILNVEKGDMILDITHSEPGWLSGWFNGKRGSIPASAVRIEEINYNRMSEMMTDPESKHKKEFTIGKMKYGFGEILCQGDIILDVKPKPGDDKDWMCGFLRDQEIEFPASVVKIENVTRKEYENLKSDQMKAKAAVNRPTLGVKPIRADQPPIIHRNKVSKTYTGGQVFEKRDMVKIKDISHDEIQEKQKHHGGMYDFMNEIRGTEGVVVEVLPCKDVIVDFGNNRQPKLNPAILTSLGKKMDQEMDDEKWKNIQALRKELLILRDRFPWLKGSAISQKGLEAIVDNSERRSKSDLKKMLVNVLTPAVSKYLVGVTEGPSIRLCSGVLGAGSRIYKLDAMGSCIEAAAVSVMGNLSTEPSTTYAVTVGHMLEAGDSCELTGTERAENERARGTCMAAKAPSATNQKKIIHRVSSLLSDIALVKMNEDVRFSNRRQHGANQPTRFDVERDLDDIRVDRKVYIYNADCITTKCAKIKQMFYAGDLLNIILLESVSPERPLDIQPGDSGSLVVYQRQKSGMQVGFAYVIGDDSDRTNLAVVLPLWQSLCHLDKPSITDINFDDHELTIFVR